MKLLVVFFALALCAGCFTSRAPETKAWLIEPIGVENSKDDHSKPEAASAFATTRLGTVVVNAPFDRTPIVVRRTDGSVAFDAYNTFAAAPSALLRASVKARVASDKRFGRIVNSSSSAGADAVVEVLVRDLSLDCRTEERRTARVAVSVDVVRAGRGPRGVVFAADGVGEADAASGDYSAAFSTAVENALDAAFRSMK